MNSAEAALLTRELTPDHHTTAADGYTTARHGAAGNGCRDAINQHSSRTRRYGAGMRRMLGLGVRCQGIAHTGDRLPSTRTSGEPAITGVGGNPSWSVPRSPNKTTFLLIPLLLQSVTESVHNFLTSRVPLQYP